MVDGAARLVPEECVATDLLTVLRDQLNSLAPKEGCGTGVCGACTVLLDGVPVAACTVLAGDTAGGEVETAVTVSAQQGADVAECLTLAGGIQCGFCSPGFVVSIAALLERSPAASDSEARRALAGNLCRCTGYGRILAAVRMVQERRGQPP
jgi:aerobic carbon-monoxide dehydrogenase small subunit